MYLLIDNYDSFTYNLYQLFAEFCEDISIVRNDNISVYGIEELAPEKIIISPGPGKPAEAGISMDVIRELGGKVPILGICLGHQCIGEAFGGRIVRVPEIVHGRTSLVSHNKSGIFSNVISPFDAARYHSLTVTDIPKELEVTAWTENDIVMGVRHREYNIIGLQFHPESFLTPFGKTLIKNFVEMT